MTAEIFAFFDGNGPKVQIVLHEWYVIQNLQNCVLIPTIFPESKYKQNCGCYVTKTSLHFQECAMMGKIFAFSDGRWPEKRRSLWARFYKRISKKLIKIF